MQEEFHSLQSQILQLNKQIKSKKINSIPSDLTYLLSLLHSLESKLSSNLNIPRSRLTDLFFSHISKYLNDLSAQTNSWTGNLSDSQEGDLIIINSKLNTLIDLFAQLPNFPSDDLFVLESDDPRWEALNKITEVYHQGVKEKVHNKYQQFMTQIASGQAFVSKGYEEVPGIKRMLMIGLGSMYYTFFKKRALKKTHLLYAQPRLEIAMHVWNLLETTMLRRLVKLVIKGIGSNQVIFVPRTSTGVLEQYEEVAGQKEFKLKYVEGSVKARLLSRTAMIPVKKIAEKAVIHVHGGGFISMSSESHQVYTNVWATELDVPIFSIDYRLAPTHPFPAGLDDVWQAFIWVLNFGKTIGIDLKSYILVGDSAGGNLVLALAYKIFQSKLLPPVGIVLAYPALRLDKDICSPSLFYALEDLLVPHTFLKLCLEAYLNGIVDIENPLISPIFIEDEVLEKFPVTRILVGEEDPLHDDCFRFAERLLRLNRDVKMAVFSGASHGGLSYSFKGGIKECRDMVSLAGKWMREIFGC